MTDEMITEGTFAVLEKTEAAIQQALRSASLSFMNTCEDTREAMLAMDKIVDIMNDFHQRAIYALVASTIESVRDFDRNVLREYVRGEGERFLPELLRNMSDNLESNGIENILDPNAGVRDEILETIQ
jgi:hypothetical protein